MIAANELRIGNWVEVKAIIDGLISIKKMRWMTDFEVKIPTHKFNEDKVEIDNISPIQLTPEILVGCGFRHEVHDDVSYYIQKDIWFCHTGDDWFLSTHTDCKSLTSLHQLQNLYFALTGEELIVNL